jgi:hypothetical protein
MPGPEGRGKTFKKGKAAPDALKAALAPPKAVDVKPTAVVAKEMFAAPKRKNAGVPKAAAAAAPGQRAAVVRHQGVGAGAHVRAHAVDLGDVGARAPAAKW